MNSIRRWTGFCLLVSYVCFTVVWLMSLVCLITPPSWDAHILPKEWFIGEYSSVSNAITFLVVVLGITGKGVDLIAEKFLDV